MDKWVDTHVELFLLFPSIHPSGEPHCSPRQAGPSLARPQVFMEHTSVITQDCNLGIDLCFPMIHSEHKAGTPVLSVFASPANVIGPGMFDLWNNHIRRRLRRGAGMCWKQTPCSAPWPRRSWCRWAADTVSDGPALKRAGEIWGEYTLSSIETWGEATERSDWGLL